MFDYFYRETGPMPDDTFLQELSQLPPSPEIAAPPTATPARIATAPLRVVITGKKVSSWIDDLGNRERYDKIYRVYH
jgi:hypothetical protein